ncbi:condensation domain-containing protein [Nonomuraea typhae]|uniref:condensation domain-containing protein n=1 Tax=Nonomuraea typhae TaxID=2603600 RepID=UPI0012FA7429|nr:condensation domain-containing protein [Nonomuraea typhae]
MTEASFTQHGMWIMERMGAGSAYHMPLTIHFAEPPERGRLAAAVTRLAERHPALTTAVEERNGVPFLVPAALRPALDAQPGDGPFDLDKGPLVRFNLQGDRLHVLAHHLIFDGQSKDVLVTDLAALLAGTELAPLAAAADFAAAQRERVAAQLEEAKEFWAARWREPGEVAVPGSRLRSRRAGEGAVLEFTLSPPALPGLTTFEVVLAALHTLLRAYGNARVTTAVDLSTRTPAETGRIGAFVNEVPVVSEPGPETTFGEFATALRAELRQVYGFREVPVARAIPGLRPHAALAPVSVSYRKAGPRVPGWEVEWLAFNQAVRGAFQLQLLDGPGVLSASLRYDPQELTDPGRVVADLRELLARIEPGLKLKDLTPFHELAVAESTEETVKETAATDDPLISEITAIWEEVLKFAPVEPDDDIFDLGGHSLTITQIIARIRKRVGVEIELDDFFDNPTIAGLVQVIRR